MWNSWCAEQNCVFGNSIYGHLFCVLIHIPRYYTCRGDSSSVLCKISFQKHSALENREHLISLLGHQNSAMVWYLIITLIYNYMQLLLTNLIAETCLILHYKVHCKLETLCFHIPLVYVDYCASNEEIMLIGPQRECHWIYIYIFGSCRETSKIKGTVSWKKHHQGDKTTCLH